MFDLFKIKEDTIENRNLDIKTFLSFLHGNGNGYIALANKGLNGTEWNQIFVSKEELDKISICSSINNYVSVNRFLSKENRYESNCQEVTGVFIDIDIHKDKKSKIDYTKEEIDIEIYKILQCLEKAILENEIPHFQLVTISGRGIALFYKYKESISIKDKEKIEEHRKLYQRIFTILEALLNKNQIKAGMDRTVRDLSRYCRIPGTKNTKSNSYASIIYQQDELTTLEALNLAYFKENFSFIDNSIDTENTLKNKINKKDTSDKNKSIKKKKIEQKQKEDIDLIFVNNQIKVPAWVANLSKRRMEQIEEIMQLRGGFEGDGRENAIFVYYNLAKTILKEKAAYEKTVEFHNTFKEPLTKREFISCINGVNTHIETGEWKEQKRRHSDGIYIFSTERFVEFMNFTEEEIEIIELYKRQNEKERAKKNKKEKVAKKELAFMMRKNGASMKEICAEIGICRSTLNTWLKDAGIEKGKKKEKSKNQKKQNSNEKLEENKEMSNFGVNKEKKEEKEVRYYEDLSLKTIIDLKKYKNIDINNALYKNKILENNIRFNNYPYLKKNIDINDYNYIRNSNNISNYISNKNYILQYLYDYHYLLKYLYEMYQRKYLFILHNKGSTNIYHNKDMYG